MPKAQKPPWRISKAPSGPRRLDRAARRARARDGFFQRSASPPALPQGTPRLGREFRVVRRLPCAGIQIDSAAFNKPLVAAERSQDGMKGAEAPEVSVRTRLNEPGLESRFVTAKAGEGAKGSPPPGGAGGGEVPPGPPPPP